MQNTKMSPQEFITILHKLLSEKVPTEALITLGSSIATLNFNDWKSVGGNIVMKDLKPIYHSSKKKVISLKELKKNIKEERPRNFFKNLAKNSAEAIKGSIKNATVSIPEAKNRLSDFSKKIVTDYNKLESNEDKGRYILKLSLYASVFAIAFNKGSKQKMLSKSTVPLIVLGITLVVINRVLEQAEGKLEHSPEAKSLALDLRSLLRTLNMGFSSGMTLNVVVDGIVDQKINLSDVDGKTIGSLMPKSIIDNMIYATLMGLFSTEAKT